MHHIAYCIFFQEAKHIFASKSKQNIPLAWKLIPTSSNQNAGKNGISVGGRLLTAEPFYDCSYNHATSMKMQ